MYIISALVLVLIVNQYLLNLGLLIVTKDLGMFWIVCLYHFCSFLADFSESHKSFGNFISYTP